jgi:hypothetical protein
MYVQPLAVTVVYVQSFVISKVKILLGYMCAYLHLQQGHSCILTRLQKSDPIFNMRVDFMRPVFNLEPTYRVTMLTREEWTRGPGTPPMVKGLIWYMDGSKTVEGTGAGSTGSL